VPLHPLLDLRAGMACGWMQGEHQNTLWTLRRQCSEAAANMRRCSFLANQEEVLMHQRNNDDRRC
jgi:hypothetical protein